MSESKLPAFQFYPGDWRKDPGVRALKPLEKYIWLEMLFIMHESEQRGVFALNGHAYPVDAFAKSIGVKPSFVSSTIEKLIQFGVATRNELSQIESRRMLRDEALRKVRKSAGSLGGNPILVNQMDNQKVESKVNQKPTPSSSSSSSYINLNERESHSTLRGDGPAQALSLSKFEKYFDLALQDEKNKRYKLLKYDLIWMHPHEFENAYTRWKESGLSIADWKNGLKRANTKLEKYEGTAKLRSGVAFDFLCSFVLTEALEQRRKSQGIKPESSKQPSRKIFKKTD